MVQIRNCPTTLSMSHFTPKVYTGGRGFHLNKKLKTLSYRCHVSVVEPRRENPIKHRQTNKKKQDARQPHVYGAIDLGTNNCRLLVAKPEHSGFRVIDSFSRIVRLGEGLGQAKTLSHGAIHRTIEALKICSEKIARRGVTHLRNVATAACRGADNHEEFLTRVREETGLKIDVISAQEEARLALAGCVSLFNDTYDHALVFDIGGGSTELIWAEIGTDGEPDILAWTSLPCGVVTLSELYGGKTVTEDGYAKMLAHVSAHLKDFETANRLRETMKTRSVQMIGTSGTVTTLAGVHLGLERYDRRRIDGLWLDHCQVQSVSRSLAGMSYSERAAQPCIGPDRADLVIAGCAIYEAISNMWPCERLCIADRGLREGMLMDLMREAKAADAAHHPR